MDILKCPKLTFPKYFPQKFLIFLVLYNILKQLKEYKKINLKN